MTLTEALQVNEMIWDSTLYRIVCNYHYYTAPAKKIQLEKKMIDRAAYVAPRLEKINKTDFLQYCDQLINDPQTTRKIKQKALWIKRSLLEFTRSKNTLLVEEINDSFLNGFVACLSTNGYRYSLQGPTLGYIRAVLNLIKAEHGLKYSKLKQNILLWRYL